MKKTREIKIGGLKLGNDNPVYIQSMTNTNTSDIDATLQQISSLTNAGCEIIRVSVPNDDSANAIKQIKSNLDIPLVADIHFDYKLAIKAIENGADCIRINPGNIGGVEKVKAVVDAVKLSNACIRIGVNSGSLEKDILADYGVTAKALCISALRNTRMMYDFGFDNFKVSIKASNVTTTIDAFKQFASEDNSPLHIGVTEAGTDFSGTIKSSVGIGTLLYLGIGDTLRVSLTSDPVNEIKVAKQILSSLDIRKFSPEVISCPTCARTEIDLIPLANAVEKMVEHSKSTCTIAVMGCVVNAIGEAREADYGIAGGKGLGILFRKGEIIKKVTENDLLIELENLLKSDNIIK